MVTFVTGPAEMSACLFIMPSPLWLWHSVNTVKANWRNNCVPNMLLMPTISWLFVVLLSGPRATWHFVAKPFRFSYTRCVAVLSAGLGEPWCLNDNMVTQDEWLYSKPCFTFTNVVIMFHSKRSSCSWTLQIKSLFPSMAEGKLAAELKSADGFHCERGICILLFFPSVQNPWCLINMECL